MFMELRRNVMSVSVWRNDFTLAVQDGVGQRGGGGGGAYGPCQRYMGL